MMNHPDLDYMLMMERRRDDLIAAAQSRLVNEALSVRTEPHMRQLFTFSTLILAFARGLSYIGEHLLTWSCRLEGRYRILAGNERPNPCA
jgi:hypothetical protein